MLLPRNVELKEAFRVADIPTSTYYRTINNATELRYETALKIFKAVDEKIKRDKYLERKGHPTVTRKESIDIETKIYLLLNL